MKNDIHVDYITIDVDANFFVTSICMIRIFLLGTINRGTQIIALKRLKP
jgi:hypothetical protein